MTADAAPEPLSGLARALGVATTYVDFEGLTCPVAAEVVAAVIASLGGDARDPARALRDLAQSRAQRLLDPVVVAWNGLGVLRLTMPARVHSGRIEVALEPDANNERQHRRFEWPLAAARITARSRDEFDMVERRLRLPALETGYHRARVRVTTPGAAFEAETLLLAAPPTTFRPAAGRGTFGVFAPLYSLHSQAPHTPDAPRGAGIGNLGDLAHLLEWSRARGASTVGTLPLLATFHDDPVGVSPYSPVSRLAWDELYLDLARLPEAAAAGPRRALVEAQGAFEAARAAPLVDYAAVDAAVTPVLAACADDAFRGRPGRAAALAAFRAGHPEVEAYARFRSARARLGPDWRRWPRVDAADGDATYRTHLYAQFALHEQLGALARAARERGGRGFYLDLPLGTHRLGFDALHFESSFASGLDTGAPPDRLFRGGQNWQFAPAHPTRIRESGYEYLRASVRAHLQYAGTLRIDHVMGLHRLYVIPRGAAASEGTYVHYRPDEAWAMLAIESHRAEAVIVGEDLGTVPPEVRRAMRRHHVGNSHVAQYEARPVPRRVLPPPHPRAIASLNTHDMPPFAGWLRGRDLDVLRDLGLSTPDADTEARAQRRRTVEALARFLHTSPTDEDALLAASLGRLAASEADLVLVSLDDLLGETEAQNLPGTTIEHANWRRRARVPLEALAGDERATALLALIAEARATQRARSTVSVAATTPASYFDLKN